MNVRKCPDGNNFESFPDARTCDGLVLRASNLGSNSKSAWFVADGADWFPVGGNCLLAQSTQYPDVDGVATGELVASVSIPANLQSGNSMVEVQLAFVALLGSATKQTLIFKHGGDTIATLAAELSGSGAITLQVYADGKYSFQGIMEGNHTVAGADAATLDFTVTADLEVFVTTNHANDVFQLYSMTAQLIK